jgi:hypothetical protein
MLPWRHAFVAVVLGGTAAVAQPTDIPGANAGNLPNVMIIFDNSRSMYATPDIATDLTCAPDDDFYPNPDGGTALSVPEFPVLNRVATGAAGACELPNTPDHTRCRNKICIGKSVMYDALDSYASLVQVGLGTYFQYLRKTELAIPGNMNSQCEYDVLAGAGEAAVSDQVANGLTTPAGSAPASGLSPDSFYALTSWTGTANCMPTSWTSASSAMSWGNSGHGCANHNATVPALNETAKTCIWDGTYNTAMTYADRTFASAAVGPQAGYSTPYATGAWPGTASTQSFSWTTSASYPFNSTGTYAYFYNRSFLYPNPSNTTFETGPFTQPCSVVYPASATYQSITTAGGPCLTGSGTGCTTGTATPGNKWRRTDGAWTATGAVANTCNAAEPCDFSMTVQRSTSGSTFYASQTQVPATVGTTCASGATCTQSGPSIASTTVTANKYTTSSIADCAGANTNYTGAALNGTAITGCTSAAAPGCSTGVPSTGPCDLAAGTKTGATSITHYAYDGTAIYQWDFGAPTGLQTMAAGASTTLYISYPGPSTGACPGGDSAGTTFTDSVHGAPASTSSTCPNCGWQNSSFSGAGTAASAGFSCTGGAGTTTSGTGARRSDNCQMIFLGHVIHTDTGVNECHYSVTQKAFTTSYYQCQYQKRYWTYACGTNYYCDWQKTVYEWKPKYYRNYWQTSGGEVIGRIQPTVAKTYSTTANLCNSGAFSSGSLPGGKCPQYLTAADDARCGGARSCRLKWAGVLGVPPASSTQTLSGQSIFRGRLNNFTGSQKNVYQGAAFVNTNVNKYCISPDWTWMSPRDPSLDVATNQSTASAGDSWCWGSNLAPTSLPSQIDVLSDPYSPSSSTTNAAASMWPQPGASDPFGAGDGRVVQDTSGDARAISFSVDGTTWNAEPPLKNKLVGWSYLNTPFSPGGQLNTGYTDDQAVLDFVKIDTGNNSVPLIKQMMSAYNASTNPTGLRVPSQWSNQNTPLYGALNDVRTYLKSTMDGDVATSCRDYAVILVTDGFEEQPTSTTGQYRNVAFDQFTSTDLQNAVTTLSLTAGAHGAPKDGVKTYIVGFGDGLATGSATTLDLMARAAGTAIPDNISGGAYTATSPADFRLQISQIFANILNGRYTRSKPLVTQTGDAIYYGFFELRAGTPEWKGYLNRYDMSTLTDTGVTPTPSWAFDSALNAQSAGARRVFVALSNGDVRDLVQYSSWSGGDKNQLQTDMGLGSSGQVTAALNYTLNPGNNAPFSSGTMTRQSRVGDVYHSVPAVIGGKPPMPASWAGNDSNEQDAYTAFQTNNVARDLRVVVGTNDGMMHAICETNPSGTTDCGNGTATAGSESWAFIPPSVTGKLNAMRASHQFAVDGSFSVSDICVASNCTTASSWKTMLLGSLRQGGNRIYALDVTDVSNPNFMFELTDATMGETWSPPTVVRATLPSKERWIAVTGGGVSTTAEIGNRVMLFDLTTQAPATDGVTSAVWRVDQNAVGCSGPSCLAKNNFPGRAALVRNAPTAPYLQQAFFGDTQGVITRLNLAGSNAVSTWAPQTYFDAAASSCSTNQATSAAQKIYDADDDPTASPPVGTLPIAVSSRQPLYQRPTTTKDAFGRNVTYTGTGDTVNPGVTTKYTCSTPPSSPNQCGGSTPAACCVTPSYDYFYAVLDTNTSSTNGYCSGTPLWVKRFKQGQKMLSEGLVAGNIVFVPTFIPPVNFCDQAGDSVIYAFDRTSGKPSPAFDPPSGSVPGTPNTSKIVLPGQGIPPELWFVANPSDPTGASGTLGIGTRAQKVNVGTYGGGMHGFRRVR